MKAFDVVAYTGDGERYCPDCGDDETGEPVFAENEFDLIGDTCTRCQACYVAGWGWTDHDTATGPLVSWHVCDECNHHFPSNESELYDTDCPSCGEGTLVLKPED